MISPAQAGKDLFRAAMCATMLGGAVASHAQSVAAANLPAVQGIEAASARRAATPEERKPILDGLHSRSAPVRTYAVRALGRLEDPSLAPAAAALLTDPSAEVRAQAADALAQTLFVKATPAATATAEAELQQALEKETSVPVKAALLESIGRLPYAEDVSAASAGELIASAIAPSAKPAAAVLQAAAVGLESLLRARKGKATSPTVIAALKALLRAEDGRTRTLALMALTVAGAADADVVTQAQKDPEPQVRRIAQVAAGSKDAQARLMLTPVSDPIRAEQRGAFIERGLSDPAPMVRLEALQAYASYLQKQSCVPVLKAVADPGVHVPLLALDLLAKPCPAEEKPQVVALLKTEVASLPAQPIEGAGQPTWHRASHALVALATIAPADAKPAMAAFLASPSWEARVYAAKAAAAMGDEADLRTLASDASANVVAAALQGLSRVDAHKADAVYIASLSRLDNQVGVAAGRALLDSKDAEATAALFTALAAYTAKSLDNTRDARLAILRALRTTGSKADAATLEPYIHDFDPAVAALAATIVSGWTAEKVAAEPHRSPTVAPNMAADLKLSGAHLRITMKNGKSFEIEMYPDQAPLTVERMVTLTRAGYFNGLTFHRWAPNWVIQGGSPGANELVGSSPFLNDEVGLLPHKRGAMGISTRGHDTGDAQLFVDLNDNDRLDHGYTVWGQVVKGMDVVDTVMEADIMQKVELVPATAHARR